MREEKGKKDADQTERSLGRRFVDSGDGILDEEGLGIEGEGHPALFIGVVPPRYLQGPLDTLGLHHCPETSGTAANLHRNPYHHATPYHLRKLADNLRPVAPVPLFDTLDRFRYDLITKA